MVVVIDFNAVNENGMTPCVQNYNCKQTADTIRGRTQLLVNEFLLRSQIEGGHNKRADSIGRNTVLYISHKKTQCKSNHTNIFT